MAVTVFKTNPGAVAFRMDFVKEYNLAQSCKCPAVIRGHGERNMCRSNPEKYYCTVCINSFSFWDIDGKEVMPDPFWGT